MNLSKCLTSVIRAVNGVTFLGQVFLWACFLSFEMRYWMELFLGSLPALQPVVVLLRAGACSVGGKPQRSEFGIITEE